MSGVEGHTGSTELPWRADGPDMFGDYNIIPFGETLAVAAVVSNMRPGAEVAAVASRLITSVNNHDDLVAALHRLKTILTVPAAEYVPAITDAWDVIDTALSRVSGSIGGGG